MKKNTIILALASSILLVSCGAGEKEVAFDQAKETASEILEATKDENFKAPTKATGELYTKMKDKGEAKISFICDMDNSYFYSKMEAIEVSDATSKTTEGVIEEWSYKEGEENIEAMSVTSDNETLKYYTKTREWSPSYTPTTFVSLQDELLEELSKAKTEKDFVDETEGIKTIKFKTSGKGNLTIEVTGDDGETLNLVIKDNLLTHLEVTTKEATETYSVTYGKADFKKPNLSEFQDLSGIAM